MDERTEVAKAADAMAEALKELDFTLDLSHQSLQRGLVYVRAVHEAMRRDFAGDLRTPPEARSFEFNVGFETGVLAVQEWLRREVQREDGPDSG